MARKTRVFWPPTATDRGKACRSSKTSAGLCPSGVPVMSDLHQPPSPAHESIAAHGGSLSSPEDLVTADTAIPSGLRIKVAFTVFTVGLIVCVSALSYFLVLRIFAELSPSIRTDLAWKALRGSAELAHATELGIIVADETEYKERPASNNR